MKRINFKLIRWKANHHNINDNQKFKMIRTFNKM